MRKVFLTMVALPFLLAGCQSPEQIAEKEAQREAAAMEKLKAMEAELPEGFDQLVGDDLMKMMSDTTMTGKSSPDTPWSFTVYRAADGSMRGESVNGGEKSADSGTWRIDNDRVCVQWKNWRDGRETCSRLYGNGDSMMAIRDNGEIQNGKELGWTTTPGNTSDL